MMILILSEKRGWTLQDFYGMTEDELEGWYNDWQHILDIRKKQADKEAAKMKSKTKSRRRR